MQLREYPIPRPYILSVTKNLDSDVSGTKRGIIDPLDGVKTGETKNEQLFVFSMGA